MDSYWKRALPLFKSLSPGQQEVFFEIVRQIVTDTVSNTLGLLDVGVGTGEFELYYEGGTKLNGDLQSLFLAVDECSDLK